MPRDSLELVGDETKGLEELIEIDKPVFIDVHRIGQVLDTLFAENVARIMLVDEVAGVAELFPRYLA